LLTEPIHLLNLKKVPHSDEIYASVIALYYLMTALYNTKPKVFGTRRVCASDLTTHFAAGVTLF